MKSKAIIDKETLLHICSKLGVVSAFLSKKIGVNEEYIAKWMSLDDPRYPTIIQAKDLAKALHFPFAGLYMTKQHVKLQNLPKMRNYRTMMANQPIVDSALNLAVVDLLRSREFLLTSMTDLNFPLPETSLPDMSSYSTAIEYGKVLRAFFEIDLTYQHKLKNTRQFYLYLRNQIEKKGIMVHCFSGLEVEEIRGIALFDEKKPIIGINCKDRYPAKAFTIVHELVHILSRQSSICNDIYNSFSSFKEEVFCNAVAGETLVPSDSLSKHLAPYAADNITIDSITELSGHYNVSKEAMTRRLLDSGHLDIHGYELLTNEIRERFEMEREKETARRINAGKSGIPRNMPLEAIDRNSPFISRLLLSGYGEGYFNKQDVSGYLGINEKHLQKYFLEVAKL